MPAVNEAWVQARLARDLRKVLNPGACLQAMNLLKSPSSDFGAIAAVLQSDPVLAIKAVAVANLIRGSRPPVTSLERAVQMLGTRHVYLIVLSVLMMSMASHGAHPTRRRRHLWRWVLAMAVAGDVVGEAAGRIPGADRQMTSDRLERLVTGLLPGLGVLLLEAGLGRSYRRLLHVPLEPMNLTYREASSLGASHWDVALWALRGLRAPDAMMEPIRCMTAERGSMEGDQESPALTMRATEVLGAWISHLERDQATVWLADAGPRLNLDLAELESRLPELRGRVLELARGLRMTVQSWDDVSDEPLLLTAGTAVEHLVVDNLQLTETLARQQWQDLTSAIARQVARHRADTDPLTGLMNRRGLMTALAKINPNGHRVSLLLMDLDRFKQINDELGHSTGDRVLKLVSRAIQETLPTPLLATRLGGDEFAVVLGADQLGPLEEWIANFRSTLRRESSSQLNRRVTVSIGAVVVGARKLLENWEHAYQDADRLLYRAKNEGRDKAMTSA